MSDLDRLSALMKRFELHMHAAPLETANFAVLSDGNGARHLALASRANIQMQPQDVPLLSARLDWGGPNNPLLAALPAQIRHSVNSGDDLAMLVSLLETEFEAQRCGVASVLDRLMEVVLVKLLREQMQNGGMETGLLAGMADTRLRRVLVALHEAPGHHWTNDSMAQVAGLSVSRFAQVFRDTMGESPSAYLRHWRLTLAKRDAENGDRVQQIASRYGYQSAEALSRAFQQAHGKSPIQMRRLGSEITRA